MIIKRGQVNTCFFTLSEKTTLDPCYYLFQFISKEEQNTIGSEKCFLAEDITNNGLRGNIFEIEETDTEDLLNGKVSLLAGQYTYKIYEQSSSTNLDPSLATNVVEVGLIDVEEENVTDASYSTIQTIKAYGN